MLVVDVPKNVTLNIYLLYFLGICKFSWPSSVLFFFYSLGDLMLYSFGVEQFIIIFGGKRTHKLFYLKN